MKDSKGITLISLVITVIVLIILASITTYSGISSIQSSKNTRMEQELEIMQAQVNVLYEKYYYGGKENPEAKWWDNSEMDEDKVITRNEIKEYLDIEGIENDFIINIRDRKVKVCD